MRVTITILVLLITAYSMSQNEPLEKYEMRVGDTLVIANTDVSFNSVLRDNRCPKDVQCVMAGYALLEMNITAGAKEEILQVKIPADQNNLLHPNVYILTEDLKLIVGRFGPYPVSTQTLNEDDYLIELWLVNH